MSSLQNAEKIDIFNHILPPKYKKELDKKVKYAHLWEKVFRFIPGLTDLDARFRIMDSCEGLKHVLSIVLPALEMEVDGKTAIELSKVANEEMAELVAKYPDRFAAAVACLPMNDINAALDETDRSIKELGFKGIQIFTPTNGKPLDSPELMPLYEKMSKYDLPIWIHPARNTVTPDYVSEKESLYGLSLTIGWPYDTTMAMARLVYGGVLEKYPNIKFITHHGGGMLPYYWPRITMPSAEFRPGQSTILPVDYFRKFYCDTATIAAAPTLMCCNAFFGSDHMLFGTDMPVARALDQTISAIGSMDLSDFDKKKIFMQNAVNLLRLAT